MAELRFLGHAGYAVVAGPVHLLVDPWIVGSAFDNGWDPLLPSASFDAQAVTHLWFSHEHPDHFSVPSVKLIPKERRPDVTVLYQETNDKRVVGFLKSQGFQDVREVRPGERVQLAPDLALTTVPTAIDGDSCHLLELAGFRMLNFNDCFYDSVSVLEDALRTMRVKPGSIDLLATQFSYANWVGNPDEPEQRRAYARYKLDHLHMQVKTVRPRYAMPFASYVYFSHEENAYLNDCANLPSRAAAEVSAAGATPILLRPADTMELSAAGLESAAALSQERARELDGAVLAAQRGELPRRKSESVALEDLLETARAGIKRLHAGLSKADSIIVRLQLPRAAFALQDHRRVLVVDWLQNVSLMPEGTPADVHISSEALRFAFSNDFGFDTLLVNGRFREARTNGAVAIKKLCGQFGYVRRRQSIVRAIVRRRLLAAPRHWLDSARGRVLAPGR